MKPKNLFFSFISIFILLSCNRKNDNQLCQYKLNQLLSSDTPKVFISFQNDTLIEVKDQVKNSFSLGLYTFDGKRDLRFYAFFVNENQYRYSEEYDSIGNILQKEGTPLLEYRLFKGNSDTIIFNTSLFSLNKKYENIELITSTHDTIKPQYLFKSNFYTNVKCFSFKLPVANIINDLVIYTTGTIVNVCSQKSESFTDTTIFKGTKLNWQ